MAGKIKVPSELVPSQSNKVMLRSKYIYDDIKGHTQEEVNAALEEQIESKVIEAGGVNWDTVPTANSNNAVKSKDIKAALEKVTGYFVLDSNVTESTVVKTVTVADFPALAIGGSIKIKMLTKNTAANPTLKIGPAGATAYPLYYNEERASANNSWEANEIISVFFDGTNYRASNAMGVSDKKVDELIVDRVGEFNETTGNIISIRTSNTLYKNVDGYVQKKTGLSGSTWATYDPIDITPYYSVDINFYCSSSATDDGYEVGTFFAKDDGEIVGERMTNTSGSYKTFIVPEGATKIYITNRRGTQENAAIRGFVKNTVKDITDKLEERVNTEESFTKYITKDIEPLILGKAYTSDEDVMVNNVIKKVGKNIEQLSAANRIIANSLLYYDNNTYQALVSIPVYNESTTYSDGAYAFNTPAGSGIAKYNESEELWNICTEDELIEDISLLQELTLDELSTLCTYIISLRKEIDYKHYKIDYRNTYGTIYDKAINSDLSWSSTNQRSHYRIPIPIDNEKVIVKANDNYDAIIVFLILANTGGTAITSDGARHVISAGKEEIFDIPPGTNNLYVLHTTTGPLNDPDYIYFLSRNDNSTELSNIVLGNKLSKVYKVGDILNLKDYHEIKGRISDDATAVWDLQPVLTTYRIPINNINKIEVKANSIQSARIQFITGREESGNASITTADGRISVLINNTLTITVPSDAVYMTVDTCVTDGRSRIPEYIKVTEIKDIKNSGSGLGNIKDIQKGIYRKQVLVTLANTKWQNNLAFLTCTDIHGASSTAKEFVEVKKYYANYINFAVHLGDTVAQNFPNDFTFWHNNGMDDVWNIVGNHDTRANGSWGDAGQEAVYNKFFKDYIDLWGIEKQDAAIDPIACYYHKDFTVRNKTVRILCLDALFVTTEQLNWLDDRLSEAKTGGYHVVVFCHYPPGFVFTRKDATISTVYFADAGSDSTDIPLLSTQITNRILAFIATGGNFVMWFNGHRHYDELGYSKRYAIDGTTFGVDEDNVPMTPNVYRIPVITLEKCSTSGYNRHEGRGIEGELNEHSFTFITIDPVEHTVKWIRYGNNVNSYMKPKNFMCYDYINKTIIGQG